MVFNTVQGGLSKTLPSVCPEWSFSLHGKRLEIILRMVCAQYDEIRSEFHFVLISLYSEFKPVLEFLNNLSGLGTE